MMTFVIIVDVICLSGIAFILGRAIGRREVRNTVGVLPRDPAANAIARHRAITAAIPGCQSP